MMYKTNYADDKFTHKYLKYKEKYLQKKRAQMGGILQNNIFLKQHGGVVTIPLKYENITSEFSPCNDYTTLRGKNFFDIYNKTYLNDKLNGLGIPFPYLLDNNDPDKQNEDILLSKRLNDITTDDIEGFKTYFDIPRLKENTKLTTQEYYNCLEEFIDIGGQTQKTKTLSKEIEIFNMIENVTVILAKYKNIHAMKRTILQKIQRNRFDLKIYDDFTFSIYRYDNRLPKFTNLADAYLGMYVGKSFLEDGGINAKDQHLVTKHTYMLNECLKSKMEMKVKMYYFCTLSEFPSDSQDIALNAYLHRYPVHIEGNTSHGKNADFNLFSIFGYEYKDVEPHISKLKKNLMGIVVSGSTYYVTKNMASHKPCKVIHGYGLNFESVKSSDYMNFSEGSTKITVPYDATKKKAFGTIISLRSDKQTQLNEYLKHLYNTIMSAFVDDSIFGANILIMNPLGLGVFSTMIMLDLLTNVTFDAIIKACNKNKSSNPKTILCLDGRILPDPLPLLENITIITLKELASESTLFKDDNNKTTFVKFTFGTLILYVKKEGPRYNEGTVLNILQLDNITPAFLNAWDDKSFIGNGGSVDNSLDGAIVGGRSNNSDNLMTGAYFHNPQFNYDKYDTQEKQSSFAVRVA